MMNETVAAVSTPRGRGGVAVIRISGGEAARVASSCFVPAGVIIPWKKGGERRAVYGSIVDPARPGETVDTGICTFFAGPGSYTGEDTAEISCHGGIAVTEAVLRAVFNAGAAPAGAGEFTRRAFINGKLTLTEAEAVGLLIDADTESRRRMAASEARGTLTDAAFGICEKLRGALASLYARIDYPDEDLGELDDGELVRVLHEAHRELAAIGESYKYGRAVADGVATVICGEPNSGKSSLYNRMTHSDDAIVTDVAGTTRDVLRTVVDTGSMTLRLSDTAGIRRTDDAVENIGVDRARKELASAELVLAVFDAAKPFCLFSGLEDAPEGAVKIAVINKTDAVPSVVAESMCRKAEAAGIFHAAVPVCAIEDDADKAGLTELFKTIDRLWNRRGCDAGHDPIIWNARQKAQVDSVIQLVTEAEQGLEAGDMVDCVCTLVEEALAKLSELDGRGVCEDIVSEIFSRFCVGK